jgi:hypothetical protein
VGRPERNRARGAWVPFLVAVTAFIALPGYMASTGVVGARFCVYVQALGIGLVKSASGASRQRLRGITVAVVSASLVLLNVRLYRFNAELDGIQELASKVEPYGDVEGFTPKSTSDSQAFGRLERQSVAAWVAASSGGLLRGDYTRFFQMPVQRRATAFPKRYRYVLTVADEPSVIGAFPDAKLVARANTWSLFQRDTGAIGDLLVVRSAQARGDLGIDQTAAHTPLSIGGVTFAQGLGTVADSFARIRGPRGTRSLEGKCGLDDTAAPEARVEFRVRADHGALLFTSGVTTKGDPSVSFSVPLNADGEVVLEAVSSGGVDGARVGWVDLHATTTR